MRIALILRGDAPTLRRHARQFDPKRRSFLFGALDGDFPAVVADHRLHDRQSEAGSVLLGRVIRSEEPRALFRRQAGAGIGDRDGHAIGEAGVSQLGGAEREFSTLWHGIDGVKHEVGQRSMQQIGVGLDFAQVGGKFGAHSDATIFL